jgi:hypothetical protein
MVPSPLRATTNIFCQLNTCFYSPYVTSSLTRGWVCCLQLLLAFASAVILGSESRGTHHILLSQIRDFPNLEGQVPIFISPGTEWPIYIPRHRVPFSSPPTTRRATVEVFEPASTRGLLAQPNTVGWVIEPRSDLQKTPPASPLLLLCDVTAHAQAAGAP